MPNALTKNDTYPALRKRVEEVLLEGRRKIEQAKVQTYWETGRIIHQDILKHATRADYGGEVVNRLSEDLNISKAVLHRCVQFAKKYPRLPIVAGRRQFNWSHYRELIAVADDKKRLAFEKSADRNAWSAEELAARIKAEAPKDTVDLPAAQTPQQKTAPLTPLRGELYTYRFVERPTLGTAEGSGILVDLGFGIFRNVEPKTAAQFFKDDIVQSFPKEDAYKFSQTDRSAKDLFTYAAFVEKVIDGDTLKVRLDLGFDTWVRQTLRLRGIDAPEMDTKEGQGAKAFVQSRIKEADLIVVRSSRSDKYDRYLADVFYKVIKTQDTRHTTQVTKTQDTACLPAGRDTRVQTGNIVYKTDRVHGLHFMARRTSYAMESDKPNGTKKPACNRPQQRTF